jgi:predicted ester cyclase
MRRRTTLALAALWPPLVGHGTASAQVSRKDGSMNRDQLVARLVKAGELEVLGGDQAETDSYFDTQRFRLHGPGGFEADYAGLTAYFKSIRAAFDERSIRRGIVIVEENHIACQTRIEGRFVREYTQSPAGSLPPNGKRVIWDLSNIFRFDEKGRLVEEWVRTDYRSFLSQLEQPDASMTEVHTTQRNETYHREHLLICGHAGDTGDARAAASSRPRAGRSCGIR